MNGLQYLLLVNLYLLLFYGFYSLLLRNETFFKMNRIFLMGSGVLSFLIPLVQSNWIQALFITQKVKQVAQGLNFEIMAQPIEQQTLSTGEILLYIYLAGAAACFLRFLWHLVRLKNALANPEKSQAFSFFKQINIDPTLSERNTILHHEQVHSGHWHSMDILFFEVLAIINWFNPVVYGYKKAIRCIHEYTADEIAAHSQGSKSEYALLLLSNNFGVQPLDLANGFWKQSLLKRRILMLGKTRSAKTALFKYGFSAPLFAAMLILSSATVSQKTELIQLEIEQIEQIELKQPVKETIQQVANIIPQNRKTNKQVAKHKTDSLKKQSAHFEKTPEFPGGVSAFYLYLGNNLKYPEEARINKTTGRVVIGFIVEKDGSLSNFKLLKGIGSGCDEEAIRVLKASPKWQPGFQNGKLVRTAFTLPISFTSAYHSIKNTNQNKDASSKVYRDPIDEPNLNTSTLKRTGLVKPSQKKRITSSNIEKLWESISAESTSPQPPAILESILKSGKGTLTLNGKVAGQKAITTAYSNGNLSFAERNTTNIESAFNTPVIK